MVNFRKNFIQKCLPTDGTAADTESLSEVLRSSPEADNSKLVAYAWQHEIPPAERLTVYKQLLGITGAYHETREIIAKHRRDEAFALLIGLRGLRCYRGTGTDEEPSPATIDIVRMLLISLNLYTRQFFEEPPHLPKLSSHASSREQEEYDRALAAIAIVKQVSHLCPGNWIDVFHVSRGIFRLIDQTFEKDGLVDQYAAEVRLNLMNNHGVTSPLAHSPDIRVHIRSCMSDLVTCNRTIFLLFDKIVTGQSITTLIRSFAVALIVTLEKKETDTATQQRCATLAVEETLRAMRSGGSGGTRPSWPRELPRPIIGRHSYSMGEAR